MQKPDHQRSFARVWRVITYIAVTKRKILIVVVSVLVVVGLVLAWYVRQSDPVRQAFEPVETAEQTRPKDAPNTVADPAVFCGRQAGALYCQGRPEATPSRYDVPAAIAKAERIQPGPAGQRLLVQSAANPLLDDAAPSLTVIDRSLRSVRQLSGEEIKGASDMTWSSNENFTVYAKSTAGGKYDIYIYDLAKGESHKVTRQAVAASRPQVSATGDVIFLQNPGKEFGLVTLNPHTGEVRQTNTAAISEQLSSFLSASYNQVSNTWFLTGTDTQQRPVLLVATYAGDVLRVERTIQDEAAYTLYGTMAGGMTSVRVLPGQSKLGLVKTDGSFTAYTDDSQLRAVFGLADQLQAAAGPAASQADDYLFDYTAANTSGPLVNYLRKQLVQDCAPHTFTSIDVLARKAEQQAVIDSMPCGSRLQERQYLLQKNDTYVVVARASGPIECDALRAAGIDESLQAGCLRHEHSEGGDDHGESDDPSHDLPADLRPTPPPSPNTTERPSL